MNNNNAYNTSVVVLTWSVISFFLSFFHFNITVVGLKMTIIKVIVPINSVRHNLIKILIRKNGSMAPVNIQNITVHIKQWG